jgi:coenzyme PQQ precursor peptide PqqA
LATRTKTGHPADKAAALRYRSPKPEMTGPKGRPMTWTTPTLVEICIGLEINGYLPAEF